MSSITIALAQMNCTVGDLTGNSAQILAQMRRAQSLGADLLLTPELSLCGYPPEDLLLRDGFLQDCRNALDAIAAQVHEMEVVVGFPELGRDGKRYNAAAVLQNGRVILTARKHDLPNYDVFDEKRYFSAWHEPCVLELKGVRFGLTICEDVWWPEAPAMAKASGAQVILSINASPYHKEKQAARHAVFREWIRATHLPMVYVNMVGGQDELVFDGASCVLDAQGEVTQQAPFFEASLTLVVFDGAVPRPGVCAPSLPLAAEVYQALVTGTRDYVLKNGFSGVLIGLSGGVDSALTLAIACDALGADKVRAVMMPSQFTAQMSLDDSAEMVRRTGVQYDVIPIRPVLDAFLTQMQSQFAGKKPDLTEENLQSRIRGTMLMALSNQTGAMVLTTGNKSEMAVGYATIYGDMAGGFAVIKDVAKTMVWDLCRWRNTQSAVIPENIITRAPTAELREDQTDQDSLPEYPVLDAIVEAYIESNRSPQDMIAAGMDPSAVTQVVGLIRRAEYKRRQAPPGVRITTRAFGRDWRQPITSRYRD